MHITRHAATYGSCARHVGLLEMAQRSRPDERIQPETAARHGGPLCSGQVMPEAARARIVDPHASTELAHRSLPSWLKFPLPRGASRCDTMWHATADNNQVLLPLELHPDTTYSFDQHIVRDYPSYLTITTPKIDMRRFYDIFDKGSRQMPLAESEMLTLRDQQYVGQTLRLSKQTRINGVDRCHFSDYELILDPKGMPAIGRAGERFWFANCTFERCIFVATGKCISFNLAHHNRLVNCVVRGGPLLEAKFGLSPLFSDTEPAEYHPLEGCDFTEADLRDAMFYRADWKDVRMPGWPHISVLSRDGEVCYSAPSTRIPARTVLDDQVKDFQWQSDAMRRSMTALVFGVGLRPHERQIQVCHAEDVARRGESTIEEVRSALDRFAHPAIRY